MSSGSAAFSPIPRDELRLQQLNQLYAQSRLPQWLLLIAAVLISPLAWANSSRPSLLLWIGLLGLLALTRQALVRRYWQASARERLQRRWSLFFHLGNLASGLCLSWVHIALTPIDNFVLQAQMYSIASGVSICVGVLYAPRYSAFASFMLPAWLPPVIWLLADGTPSSLVWAQTGAMMFCFILLAAALLSPRPPELMVLNEPEASLHGDLIEPLARLLRHAARTTQIVVVSHSQALVDALDEGQRITLEKRLGETVTGGSDVMPRWNWPSR